ncbi:hypothetical protein POL68_27920 [Stigmatella sp. ncwal1]|uniref:Uncharacterized protein n=1 Tax=Stigmatella ashevillensis TaxID=2995309 RepID=A0ABT5DJ05_9BACT|nr:hypothetical protein [Stigmatella ashevillena]MDC0712322.1 hypothetical protein [Stigmatella ashevillena]
MPYIALEWDHRIGKPMIRYVVVQCAGLSVKCGGPQALAPRRDIAYFVNEETAAQDAQAFADYKNAQAAGRDPFLNPEKDLNQEPRRHLAFGWDHLLHSPLIQWAVLEWGGEGGTPMPRTDVAYFLDPAMAERDAKAFSWMRDDWKESADTQGRVGWERTAYTSETPSSAAS